ncbi:MAG: TolC family protein [Phycisphaeraceae bacterium]|nr:TolC family protein [Phycisphaeraceae bacterium]
MNRHVLAMPRSAAMVLVLAGTAGCVSTDPRADVERSQALIAERAGLHTDWLTPLDAAADRWDGESDLAAGDAVAIALARNPALRAQLEVVAAARADLAQAGLLPNPVLSLSLGFPIAGADGGTSVGASLVQNFASLLSRGRRIDAAAADLDRAVLELSDHALALAARTHALHTRADFAERAAALGEENASLVRRSLQITNRRVEAGEASRLDANRVRVVLLQTEVESAHLRAAAEAARRELLATMGLPGASASWRPAASPDAPVPVCDEQAVIELALTLRLDVAAAQAAANAAAARAGAADRSRLTDIEAGADYERDEDGRDTLGPSIAVEVPLFDTGAARAVAARAEARRAEHEAAAIRNAAIGQARAAWVNALADARAANVFAAEIVQLADENLDLARRAYDAGETDLTVLLDTQRERLRVKLELIRLRERAALSRIELWRAGGGRLPD